MSKYLSAGRHPQSNGQTTAVQVPEPSSPDSDLTGGISSRSPAALPDSWLTKGGRTLCDDMTEVANGTADQAGT